MANFKTCSNGHNYDPSKYNLCPFCPGNTASPDYEKTMLDFKKTQGMDEGNSSQFAKTMINEEKPEFKTTPTTPNAQHPFKRTSIVTGDSQNPSQLPQTERRKLVGWLVTFTNDEFGQDYKLYFGKNKIGTAAGCDIIITDPSVSGEHTTILFRDNEFLIKDHFSTNGTKINGVTIDEGKLTDGDELKLGNTSFKLKTVF